MGSEMCIRDRVCSQCAAWSTSQNLALVKGQGENLRHPRYPVRSTSVVQNSPTTSGKVAGRVPWHPAVLANRSARQSLLCSRRSEPREQRRSIWSRSTCLDLAFAVHILSRFASSCAHISSYNACKASACISAYPTPPRPTNAIHAPFVEARIRIRSRSS